MRIRLLRCTLFVACCNSIRDSWETKPSLSLRPWKFKSHLCSLHLIENWLLSWDFFYSFRCSHPELLCQKDVIKNFAKFTIHKAWGIQIYLKRDSDTNVFKIFAKFLEHFFNRTPPGDCFCSFKNLYYFNQDLFLALKYSLKNLFRSSHLQMFFRCS